MFGVRVNEIDSGSFEDEGGSICCFFRLAWYDFKFECHVDGLSWFEVGVYAGVWEIGVDGFGLIFVAEVFLSVFAFEGDLAG
jgi:hypothetical protein